MLGRVIVRMIAMAPGVGLAVLGLSGLQSGYEANRGLASVLRLEADPEGSPESYEATAALLTRRGLRDGELSAMEGLLYVQLADRLRRAGDAAGAVKYDTMALAPLERAIRNIPLEPRAWTALAWVKTSLGDSAGAVAALQPAFLSRNLIVSFVLVRTKAALRNWAALDEGARSSVVADLQAIWAKHEWRKYLAEVAAEPGSDEALTLAFRGNPEAVRWINRSRARG